MPFYALALVPLMKRLTTSVAQVWYADDAAATEKIMNLRKWWDDISTMGPPFGYHANASKTWLVVKPEFLAEASAAFADTNVRITSEGRPYLGGAIGSEAYVKQFVAGKVLQYPVIKGPETALCDRSLSASHAAFAAYTHGMKSKWSYLSRILPDTGHHLQALEDIIRCELLPALTGCSPLNDTERKLVALPARLGGLGLLDPSLNAEQEYNASLRVTAPLQQLLNDQYHLYSYEALVGQMTTKSDIQRETLVQTATSLCSVLSPALQNVVDLATLPGSSAWLTCLPIREHVPYQGAFVDALALRYDWPLQKTTSSCEWRAKFTVDHLLSCLCGGFPSLCHNDSRDLTAILLAEHGCILAGR